MMTHELLIIYIKQVLLMFVLELINFKYDNQDFTKHLIM